MNPIIPSSILWYSIRFISDLVIRNCTAISRSETLLTELLRRISQIWLPVVYKSHHHHYVRDVALHWLMWRLRLKCYTHVGSAAGLASMLHNCYTLPITA